MDSIALTTKDIQKFWFRVGEPNPRGCREWTKKRNDDGYGEVYIRGKVCKANRIAWVLTNNQQIPEGLQVCHTCDNPPCCEGSHLFLGTHKDNMQDKAVKGRVKTTKLTTANVREARNLYATGKWTQKQLAQRYGVNAETLRNALTGSHWEHVTMDKPYKTKPREHAANAKLTKVQVLEIRAKYKPGTRGGNVALANEYGVSVSAIERIVGGTTWTNLIN